VRLGRETRATAAEISAALGAPRALRAAG